MPMVGLVNYELENRKQLQPDQGRIMQLAYTDWGGGGEGKNKTVRIARIHTNTCTSNNYTALLLHTFCSLHII